MHRYVHTYIHVHTYVGVVCGEGQIKVQSAQISELFGFDTLAQLLALASPSRVIQYRNSRDWEIVVLLLMWSYY